MNFPRILANAFARRISYVIVAALLAWIGLSKAHAAEMHDQGAAYAAAIADANLVTCAYPSGSKPIATRANGHGTPVVAYFGGYQCMPAAGVGPFWYERNTGFSWPAGKTCSTRSSYLGSINATKLPDLTVCKNGCSYTGSGTGITDQWVSDGTLDETPGLWVATTFTPGGGLCSDPPPEEKPECPAGKHRNQNGTCVEEGDCPVGQSMIGGVCTPDGKCPTGKTKAPDGSCIEESCPAGKAKGKDGTCKTDADGDGVVDEEEEGNEDGEKFSGGDSCDSPPVCSGSAIMCGQARIQWRIDCNTRKDRNIVGGSCDAMPICVGKNCDAMEYSQLLMQWRTSCKEASEGGNGETGIKDHMTNLKQAEVNALRALGTDDGHAGVNESDIFHTYSNSDFNPNMFGSSPGGSCSFGATLEIMGHPIDLPASFWTVARFIGLLIVACAYLWVAFQLGS